MNDTRESARRTQRCSNSGKRATALHMPIRAIAHGGKTKKGREQERHERERDTDPASQVPHVFNYSTFALSRSELPTTEMLERAIAAPAKIGFKRIPKNGYRTPAATGINAML